LYLPSLQLLALVVMSVDTNAAQNHTATYGFAPHRRHAVRVAVRAELPYLDPKSRSQEDEVSEKFGVPKANKDGSGVVNYND
jgi:sulfonate dioxygenase